MPLETSPMEEIREAVAAGTTGFLRNPISLKKRKCYSLPFYSITSGFSTTR